MIRNGLRWRDSQPTTAAQDDLQRFMDWSPLGVFNRDFVSVAAEGGKAGQVMIGGRISRHSGSLPGCSKRGSFPMYRAHQRGPDFMLHAVRGGSGRPLDMLLTEGQTSDHDGRR